MSYPNAPATPGAAPTIRPSPITGAMASSTPVISSSVAPAASAWLLLHSRQTSGAPIAASTPTRTTAAVLESHRPAHLASAHHWDQCTPARGGFHRPNEVKKNSPQPSGNRVAPRPGNRVAPRRPAGLRPETSLALILTALTAPVAPAPQRS